MKVGLLTTAVFDNLSGYSYSETSEIRPAILCGDMLPVVTDCKMSDLE